MQQNEYENPIQTVANERVENNDPRETGGIHAFHAAPQFQPRRLSGWRLLAFCGVALMFAALITWLTGGFAFNSLQKVLPTRTFILTGRGALIVNEAEGGTLSVHSGSVNQVIVRASEHACNPTGTINNLQIQYEQSGNTITVSSNGAWALIGNTCLDLDITVPTKIDVTVHNNSADATIKNIEGQIDASTSSGDISLDKSMGPLELETSSGDIAVTNELGPVIAQTSSGHIHLNHGSGPLRLSTESGDIAITDEQGAVHAQTSSGNIQMRNLNGPVNLSTSSGDITLDQAELSGQDYLRTTSGDIRFSGTLNPQGNYQMETDSGTITLELPASSSFQLTTASNSGDLRNDFAANVVGGAPYAIIDLRTTSGDMCVQKQ